MDLGDIAIITSSGRAYFKLVSELKKRGLSFLSLTQNDPIPITVRAIVTTKGERDRIRSSHTFIYDPDEEASHVIDRVIQSLRGKKRYVKLVLGVDPGKRLGLAIMGDGLIIRTETASSIEEAAESILDAVNRIEADEKIVKIGDGAQAYHSSLIKLLNEELPPDVAMESVEERGTTRMSGMFPPRVRRAKDVYSAIRISMKRGRRLKRRR